MSRDVNSCAKALREELSSIWGLWNDPWCLWDDLNMIIFHRNEVIV